MVYINHNKQWQEWENLSEEELKARLKEKSHEFRDFVYGFLLPASKRFEEASRKARIEIKAGLVSAVA